MRIRSILALALASLCAASGCGLQATLSPEPSPSPSATADGPKMKVEDRSNRKARQRSFDLPQDGKTVRIDGGTDIPPGRYGIFVSGSPQEPINVLDSRPDISEARPFYSQNFEIPQTAVSAPNVAAYTMDISEDERLTVNVKGGAKLLFRPQMTSKHDDISVPGEWVAGVDFPAGSYKVKASAPSMTRIYRADGSRTFRGVLGRKDEAPVRQRFDDGDVLAYNPIAGDPSSAPTAKLTLAKAADATASPSSPGWKDTAPKRAAGSPIPLNAKDTYRVGNQIPSGYYKIRAVAPEQLASLTFTMHKDRSQALGRILVENSDRSPIPRENLADVHLVSGQSVNVDAKAVNAGATYHQQGRGEPVLQLVPADKPKADVAKLTRSSLLVGSDIPEGTYEVTVTERGYYDVMVASSAAITYWFTNIGRTRNENTATIELRKGEFITTDTNSYVQLAKMK